MLPILFGLTLFISAALLFWVQLFTAKMVLPVLGGSAAVWNTCMVFFQIALLLGYLYAHVSERFLPGRFKSFLHPVLLLIAGAVLPVSLHGIAPPEAGANPVPWLLTTLSLIVGAPFLILAGTAPLLQAFLARAGTRSSHDPYFLYAASNLGSLLALLSYPTLVEPHLPLVQQRSFWAIGYFLLIFLTALCAAAAYASARTTPAMRPAIVADDERRPARPTVSMRLRWVLLAFAPSSLLLGVTTHLTTDVAAAPLFWVIPLVLYLLTFVLAFQRWFTILETATAFLQALLLVCLAVILLSGESNDILPLFGLHLAAFFMTALLCNQELVRLRPPPLQLTEFYLLISLGGALGGIFNALLAPVLFNDIIEYPLILVVACMLRPGPLPLPSRLWPALGDVVLPALMLAALVFLDRHTDVNFADLSDSSSLIAVILATLAAFGFRRRPIRFALGIGALITAGFLVSDSDDVLAHTRNFYGVLKVVADDTPPLHTLYNGTTLHGSQSQEPELRLQPLSYYHPEGPLGQLFARIGGSAQTSRVGVVGLGTGTIACYAKPGEHWSFFEINAADVAIARDRALFTFLSDCPAHPDIVLGDARLSLMKESDASFDMIILDAFTSDAIPIHLITSEAVQLYLAKLHDHGLIVFHISNRYLDLGPIVGNIAAALNLTARRWDDEQDGDPDDPETAGKTASDWVIVARDDAALKAIAKDARWKVLPPSPGQGVWTDDYSNLLGALAP